MAKYFEYKGKVFEGHDDWDNETALAAAKKYLGEAEEPSIGGFLKEKAGEAVDAIGDAASTLFTPTTAPIRAAARTIAKNVGRTEEADVTRKRDSAIQDIANTSATDSVLSDAGFPVKSPMQQRDDFLHPDKQVDMMGSGSKEDPDKYHHAPYDYTNLNNLPHGKATEDFMAANAKLWNHALTSDDTRFIDELRKSGRDATKTVDAAIANGVTPDEFKIGKVREEAQNLSKWARDAQAAIFGGASSLYASGSIVNSILGNDDTAAAGAQAAMLANTMKEVSKSPEARATMTDFVNASNEERISIAAHKVVSGLDQAVSVLFAKNPMALELSIGTISAPSVIGGVQQAKDAGLDNEKAGEYGLISGGIQYGTEHIPFELAGYLGKYYRAIGPEARFAIGKKVGSLLGIGAAAVVAEGPIEEGTGAILQNLTDNFFLGTDKKWNQDWAENSFQGSIQALPFAGIGLHEIGPGKKMDAAQARLSSLAGDQRLVQSLNDQQLVGLLNQAKALNAERPGAVDTSLLVNENNRRDTVVKYTNDVNAAKTLSFGSGANLDQGIAAAENIVDGANTGADVTKLIEDYTAKSQAVVDMNGMSRTSLTGPLSVEAGGNVATHEYHLREDGALERVVTDPKTGTFHEVMDDTGVWADASPDVAHRVHDQASAMAAAQADLAAIPGATITPINTQGEANGLQEQGQKAAEEVNPVQKTQDSTKSEQAAEAPVSQQQSADLNEAKRGVESNDVQDLGKLSNDLNLILAKSAGHDSVESAVGAGSITPLALEQVDDASLSNAIPAEARGVAEKIAGAFGKRIVYIRDKNGNKLSSLLNGAYGASIGADPNVIYINGDGSITRFPHRIVSHEILHALRFQAPEVYDTLLKAIHKHINTTKGAEHLVRRKYIDAADVAKTAEDLKQNKGSVLVEELVADAFADILSDPSSLDQLLSRMKPSLAQKFLAEARKLLDKMHMVLTNDKTLKSADYADLTKMREHVIAAAKEYARRVEAGEVKGSDTGEGHAMLSRPSVPKNAKLDSSVKAEGAKALAIVSSKPGRELKTAAGAVEGVVIYPKQSTAKTELTTSRLHERVSRLLSGSDAQKFITSVFPDLNGVLFNNIRGLWNHEREDTFVIRANTKSGDPLTFDQARQLSNLLSFGFLQEGAITSAPSTEKDVYGAQAVLIARPDGKKLTRSEIDKALREADNNGMFGAGESLSGKAIKFIFFPEENSALSEQDQYKQFLITVDKIRMATGLTNYTHFTNRSTLDYAKDFWKLATGSQQIGMDGEDGGGARSEEGAAGSRDLFRGAVDNLVAPYIAEIKTEGFGFDSHAWQRVFGATDAQREYLEAKVAELEDVNKHGVIKKLRQQISIAGDKLVGSEAKLTLKTTSRNVDAQLNVLDEILAAIDTPEASTKDWLRLWAVAYGTGDVPMAPNRFIQMFNGDGIYNQLKSLSKGQTKDADHGFRNAAEFRKLYESGKVKPETTAKLMLWSFLSRGVSPYVQESAFIDLVDQVGPFVDKALKGSFTAEDEADWERIVSASLEKGSGKPGSGSTHNANAFGSSFLASMAEKMPDGRTKMKYLHDLFSDKNMTGQQIRREFVRISEGVGIDNKVISFTLLVIGHDDVAVLDRVQIANTFNDGRLPGYNLYDGVTRYGYRSGEAGDYKVHWTGTDAAAKEEAEDKGELVSAVQPGSGLANITTGVRGLLLYEALERALNRKLPEIYGRLKDEGLRSKSVNPSAGRWHWESWVAYSGQEASHKTLDALLNEVEGRDDPFADTPAKQGEYGSYDYGTEYAIDKSGTPYKTISTSTGVKYRFSLDGYTKAMKQIKKKGKHAVAPSGFKVSVNEDGTDRSAPWFEDKRVDREKLDSIIKDNGEPATQLSRSSEEESPVFGDVKELDQATSKKLTSAWMSTINRLGDDVYRFPRSNASTLEDVARDVSQGEVMVSDVSSFYDLQPGETMYRLSLHNPKGGSSDTFVTVDGDSVWINIASFKEGGGGSMIYSIVGNYANNNPGMTFIGDPDGLSDVGLVRRLINMASLATKFGNTEFLKPHKRQMLELKKYGFAWETGNDQFNLARLLFTAYNVTREQLPEVEGIDYDEQSDTFSRDGEPLTDEYFDSLAKQARESNIAGAPGSGTIKVAAAIGSLVSSRGREAGLPGERSGRAGRLLGAGASEVRPAGLSNENPQLRALYSHPEEGDLPEKFAVAVNQSVDSRAKTVTQSALELAENDRKFVEAKRGVVPHATSESRAEAFAKALGWDVAEVTKLMGEAAAEGVPIVDVLGAAIATARVNIARVLESKSEAEMLSALTDTINLMIATRAHVSEIARALGYMGWLQRKGGWKQALAATEQVNKEVKKLVEETAAQGETPEVKALYAELNKALDNTAQALQDHADEVELARELEGQLGEEKVKEVNARLALKQAKAYRKALEKKLNETNSPAARAKIDQPVIPKSALTSAKERMKAVLAAMSAKTADTASVKLARPDVINHEFLVDGMTIAADYLMQGMDYDTYHATMVEEFGDAIRPYLLSFYEGARNYPGVDIDQTLVNKTQELEDQVKRLEPKKGMTAEQRDAAIKARDETQARLDQVKSDIKEMEGEARKALRQAQKAAEEEAKVSDTKETRLNQLNARIKLAEKAILDAQTRAAEIKAKLKEQSKAANEALRKLNAEMKKEQKLQDQLNGVLHKQETVRKARAKRKNEAPKEVAVRLMTEAQLLRAFGGPKNVSHLFETMRKHALSNEINQVLTNEFLQGVAKSVLAQQKYDVEASKAHKFMRGWAEQFSAFILTGALTHFWNLASTAAHFALNKGLIESLAAMGPGGVGLMKHGELLFNMAGVMADIKAAAMFQLMDDDKARQLEVLLSSTPDQQRMMLEIAGHKWMDDSRKALPGKYGSAVRYSFKILGAEDAIFKVLSYRYELRKQQALGQAPDHEAAINAANFDTFTADVGIFSNAIAQFKNKHPALVFIVPFVKTLTNITKRAFELSAVGAIPTAMMRGDMSWYGTPGVNGQDAANKAYATALVAASLAAIAVLLHGDDDDKDRGLIGLDGMPPVSKTKKALWSQTHANNGLRIGNTHIDMSRLSPISDAIGIDLAMYRMFRDWKALGPDATKEDMRDIVANAGSTIVYNLLLGKSWMQQPEQLLQSIIRFDAPKVARWATGIVYSSLVPNFFPQVGDMLDDKKRGTRHFAWSVDESLLAARDEFVKKIPFARESLDPQLDIFGHQVDNPRAKHGLLHPGIGFDVYPERERELSNWLMKIGKGIADEDSLKNLKDLDFDTRQRLLIKRRDMLDNLRIKVEDTNFPDKDVKAAADRVTKRWGEMVKLERQRAGL